MPTFTLDDIPIPFERGDTVIAAAQRAGIDIPHYCWHPGLSIAANCRMCLVELGPPPGRSPLVLDVLRWDEQQKAYVKEQKPKLVPACQQSASEGMQIKSQTSPHVARARASVQEMLLLNHPVDCPICDQAGECRLQDYWLEHQGTKKRMRDEPVHKPKAVPFGPTIVYDAERCIVCTRCIRVCDELAKDPVLSIRERGNLAEVVLAPGRQLDHPYSLMTEYVCPVGALTAVDFRFKARVWFLRAARSVCVGCATGCNSYTDFDPRDQRVYRYRPRANPDVNKFWMCDEGMLDYQRIHQNRALAPRIKGEPSTREAALDRFVAALDEYTGKPERVAVVLSAEHSNEDNFALRTLCREHLGFGAFFLAGRPHGEGDDILRHPDKNPNTRGVGALPGSTPPLPFRELAAGLDAGRYDVVVALGSQVADPENASALEQAKHVLVIGTHGGPLTQAATVLLPASSWAESDGTFVNAHGSEQESDRAIAPLGESRPAWKWVTDVARALGHPVAYKKVDDVRSAMRPAAAAAPVAKVESAAQPGAAE